MKNACNLLKMKKIDIKIIFLFTFIFISVFFVNARKEIKQTVIQDYRIQEVKRQNERLQQQIDSLRIEVEKTKIGTEYFNTLFDNQNSSYGFILTGFAIILGLGAFISWGIFWKRVSTVESKLEKKFTQTIRTHQENENVFFEKFESHQCSSMIFITNLSIMQGGIFRQQNKYEMALFCYLYSIYIYSDTYYNNLSLRAQNKLLEKKDDNLKVLKSRLSTIDNLLTKIIEKPKELDDILLKKCEEFKSYSFYISSPEIEKLRIDLICKMNTCLK